MSFAILRRRAASDVLVAPQVRVATLAVAIGVAAAAIYERGLEGDPAVAGSLHLQWWALAPIFLLAEAYPVHVQFRHETHSVSMSDFALVLGLFLAAPSHMLAGQLLGCAAAVLLIRRQRPLKAMFNLAQFAFTSCTAIFVFRVFVGHGSPYGLAGWAGSLAAASAAAILGVLVVAAAIQLTEGAAHLRELPFVLAVGVTSALTCVSLAIAVLELERADARALWVLAVPVALTVTAFRAYAQQRRRRQHTEFLYTSMRAIQSAPNLRLATHELLQAARTIVSAEVAKLVMVSAGGGGVVSSTIDPSGERLLEPAEVTEATELALRAAALAEHAILLPREREPHVLDAYLAELAVPDAILAPIRGESGLSGMLILGARTGEVASFTVDDRKLLETLASHVTVVLENDQAREQLQHQAYHDDLTGLGNRALFTDRCAASLQAETGGGGTVVLFLDLDDFKTINDSLGHGAGDELLVAVADRIRACAGPGVLASRLGGDEFALLLSRATLDDADELASAVLGAFEAPIVVDGREFRIHPSIGVAGSHGPGTTAEELLRNADVAMYSAKDGGKRRSARYEPEMHARARRRQELASDLERAIEQNELCVHYQPILELATGRLFALEALVRWNHPDHGVLSPASFVPLAEDTGLVGAIGRIVRRDACAQLAEWRTMFPDLSDLSVTVNLSPPELQDRELRKEIEAALAATGVPGRNLILEVTESSAVQEPEVTIGHLRELRRLGVRIALDDFGTGYSSLSHLRDLPLDVIKVAKPFVDGLAGSGSAELFLTAILQLSHALRLDVIAEGIEQRSQAETLQRLGCRLVQGYLYSRPLPAVAAAGYLRGVPKDAPRAASRPAPRTHLRRARVG